jgi:peptidoglycan biosynthesis protein MviN/MurJ (putative lipid II flippase)
LLRRGDWAPAPGLARFCFAVLLATAAMALALVLALPDAGVWFTAPPWVRGTALAGLVALGLIVYAGVLTLLGYGPRWLRALLAQ